MIYPRPPRKPDDMNGEHEALWRFLDFLSARIDAAVQDRKRDTATIHGKVDRILWTIIVGLSTVIMAIISALLTVLVQTGI